MLVLGCQLFGFSKNITVAYVVYSVDFITHAHGMAFGYHFVAAKGKGSVVVHTISKLSQPVIVCKVYIIYLRLPMPYTDEIYALGIFIP